MTALTKGRAVGDTYYRLIRTFPLVPIRDDAHWREAVTVVDGLSDRALDASEEQYLEALASLIEAYENGLPGFDPAPLRDVLRLLMESHDETQATLARKAQVPKSILSELLSGRRRITLGVARKLAPVLGVPAGILVDSDQN